jgi:PAS domain S-box-containing protein
MTTRRSKTPKPKGHNTTRATASRPSAAAQLRKQLDRRARELATTQKRLTEALQQQTATSEVLRVISSSQGELQSVFDSLVENATRVCGANFGTMTLYEDDTFRTVALHHVPEPYLSQMQLSFRPHPKSGLGRVARSHDVVQITDLRLEEPYLKGDPAATALVDLAQARTIVVVPMLKSKQLVGAIGIFNQQVRRFTDRQIELLNDFAKQAVIAVENARLVDELRQRTDDLSESLQQQIATADVLKVISRSAFDVQTVLETLVKSAARLCEADSAFVYQRDADVYRLAATYGFSADYENFMKPQLVRPGRGTLAGRTALEANVVHIPDILTDPEYTWQESQARGGYRTMLGVPMLREGFPIGVFAMTRSSVKPFTNKQIALLQTFTDQAVIAIENARLFDEVQAKTHELEKSLEYQTAISDVLKIISRSAFDLQPVLDTVCRTAQQLCGAELAGIAVRKGEGYRYLATSTVNSDWDRKLRETEFTAGRGSVAGRAALEGRVVHIADLVADMEYRHPEFAPIGGARTALGVPLLREGEPLGVIFLGHDQVRPFTTRQIDLVRTFADQAVIAIENTRLFNEIEQRTEDLSESLQQQTATADVLKVLSRSAFDVHAVLTTLVESAARLCQAETVQIFLRDGELYRPVAHSGFSPEYQRYAEENPIAPGRGTLVARTALELATVHIPDVLLDPEYTWHEGRKLGGFRAMLGVPLLREQSCIGVMAMTRLTARPFTDRQIELVRVFADQAVIAIENARLFDELRDRQAELARSVDELTATSDVLKIISRSSVDLKTVLDTLVETVARLCRADQTVMFRRLDARYHPVASHGLSGEAEKYLLAHPLPPDRGTLSGRVELERRPVHIDDVLQDQGYSYQEGQKIQGYRTMLGIPLLREGTLIGIFVINRTHVEPFTKQEIELATTFADQAMIAIENARLFEELRERQAELRVTFDNMGDGVVMFDAQARLAAWNRNFQEMLDLPDVFLAGRPSYADYFRYLADRGEYSSDLEEELSRTVEDTRLELRFERTRPDGRVIEVRRNPVPDGGFVLIYADITERKRAEEAIRLARDAAEKALRDLQTAQDRLVQTQKLASLGQLTAGIAHEIKNPLNFVNNFSALSVELADELNEVMKQLTLTDMVHKEVDELTTLLKDNLGKVVQHGKRVDSIVKNMLLHSREGSGEQRATDINSLVDESLNLAYHGARAETSGFNITLERDFDAAVGVADIYPQEITRVLLNLISNGFYAATQRARTAGNSFEPRLKAVTRNLGDRVEVRIRDNGAGIPPNIQEKIFNPFFTTKPAGEGTGLGLSMSHDIVVKQHGGTIELDTEPGSFAEFIIRLPRVMPT